MKKTKAELKAARDERSAIRTLKRLRGEVEHSKNHHGYIVTSPTGSVSLKDLPVPTHGSRDAASKWGKAQGKPFCIVPASDFFRTSFGKMVQSLTHKRIEQKRARKIELLEAFHPKTEVERVADHATHYTTKGGALTNLLSRLKASAQDRRLDAKAKTDTPKPLKASDIIARQLRTVGQALDESRKRLSDQSHLTIAMQPPKSTAILHASDSDLISLYSRQDNETQRRIDVASKFRWDKRRINKLVKSNTVENILILFRAGKLPDNCRTRKLILKEINK